MPVSAFKTKNEGREDVGQRGGAPRSIKLRRWWLVHMFFQTIRPKKESKTIFPSPLCPLPILVACSCLHGGMKIYLFFCEFIAIFWGLK